MTSAVLPVVNGSSDRWTMRLSLIELGTFGAHLGSVRILEWTKEMATMEPVLESTSERTMAEPEKNFVWRLSDAIGPDVFFAAIFASLLAVLAIAFQAHFNFNSAAIVYPLLMMLLLILIALSIQLRLVLSGKRPEWAAVRKRCLALLRDWFPLVLLTFIYENLHDLTDSICPQVVDGTLFQIDKAIFGVEPSLALQAVTTPWLTELMTIAYALYFAHPLILLTILYQRGSIIQFREMFLALNICFYLGFLGYILVPAIGPRYFMPERFQVELTGPWLTSLFSSAWSTVQSVKRDCFPSLHTAISTISLIYLFRYWKTWKIGRFLLFVQTPLIFLLWISTLYLRYHWAIDVLAGFVLAYFCARMAPMIIRSYYRRKLGTVPLTSLDAGCT